MDDNSLDSHVLTIVHYLKSKYYKHAQLYADAVMEKHGSDSVISFWKASSMMLIEGSLQEAVRVLKTLESKRDLLLSCRMALLKANQLMGQSSSSSGKASQDQNQQGLESVMMDRSDLSEVAWFQAVLFSLIFYSENETVQLITKGLKAHQGSKEQCVTSMKALLLRIQLKTNDISSLNHEVAKLLEKESSNPWVYYNHVSMVYDVGASEEALKLVNKYTEKKPQTIALLILRLKILASCGQWDSILETSSDLNAAHVELLGDSKVLLNAQPNTTKYHLESILALCMYNLCKQSIISVAEQQVQIIMAMLQDLEPNNAELRIHIVRNLAKMWTKESKNFYSCLKQILDQVTLNGTEPFAAEYMIAKAETYKNQPNALQKAEEVYSTVLKKDPSNADALEGKLLCNLFKGETMNAFEQDITVLLEARRRSGRTGVAHFLQFMDTKDLKYLRASLKDSVREISRMQVEFGAYNQLNPSLVCFILNTCLKYNRISFSEFYAPDDLVVLMKDIVKDLERFVPGWNDLLLISAKIKILNNDYAGAKSFVHQCIKADSSDIEAFLLQAELLLKAKQPKAAIQVLDSCLSLNFAARNSVKYYSVRAFAYKDCSRFDESLECIKTAVLMISSTPQDENQAQKVLSAERRDDMFYILLEKVDLLLLKNDIKAAEATLDDARKAQRSSKTGEPLLIMKQADIELHSSDGKNWRKVLELLETVKYDGPSTFQVFKQAMVKKSKILLKNGNDTKAFLDVYKELYEKFPESADISILYGDALLSVEQVNEATTIFEQVMQKFPEKESELTCKIGRALTKSLKFNKALTFYEKLLSKPEQKSKRSMMFYDYVSLKKKLGHNEAVIELIKVEMKTENSQLLDEGIFRILALVLLSDIYNHNGDIDTALVALKKAVSQANVLSQYFGLEADIAGVPCNRLLSNISVRIAELYHKQGKVEHACKSCNEAISYDIQNYAAQLSLSRLHLEKNDLPSAQNCCASVLKTDPMNEDAVLIHTKILFKQKNFNGAVSHLKPFLDKNPTCFEALWIYIELYNSLGKLTSIQPNKDIENLFIKIERLSGAYLSKEYDAQKIKSTSNENVPSTNQIAPGETSVRDSYIFPRDTGKAAIHRGYQFCKGIYLKHRRDASEALKCFHYCLNDTNYGELALKHMIDIYLEATNPAAPIPEDSASNSSLQPNSGLLIAQKLLSDNLKGDIHSLLKQSLYHRVLVASRQKNEIERTIPEMQTLVEKQPNFAPGVLALGSAFLALKQNQRAKNVFQSLIKTEWPFEFAQDYEKCFLYLADIQIQYSKFDAAMECFKLCIGYNQACSKAYEGLGFLMEREASYANAAGLYEQAWKHLRENDPALGFKLAYCYLKCKKYVEAIVVCHKILKDYPSYPRLKKEILDKARSLIRQPV